MSTRTIPLPARLLCSLLFRADAADSAPPAFAAALAALAAEYGPIDFQSPPAAFTKSPYYYKEMGAPLFRCFVTFARLIDRARLAEVKEFAWSLEERLSPAPGHRAINIDPGLLTLESLVLATGKNFTHRVYLRDGIFAEVTLLYQKGRFQTLPWTYPDYAAPETLAMLAALRARYAEELKHPSATA